MTNSPNLNNEPNRPNASAGFKEKLDVLKDIVWDTLLDGYDLKELAQLFKQDVIYLYLVVQCTDGVNGGEYWKLSIEQVGRAYPLMIESIGLQRLLPTQDGASLPSLRDYCIIGDAVNEGVVKRGGSPYYLDVCVEPPINNLIHRLEKGVVLDDVAAQNILRVHKKLVKQNFPDQANVLDKEPSFLKRILGKFSLRHGA